MTIECAKKWVNSTINAKCWLFLVARHFPCRTREIKTTGCAEFIQEHDVNGLFSFCNWNNTNFRSVTRPPAMYCWFQLTDSSYLYICVSCGVRPYFFLAMWSRHWKHWRWNLQIRCHWRWLSVSILVNFLKHVRKCIFNLVIFQKHLKMHF